MNVQIGADDVLLNLDRNQRAFEKTVSQLSSGLRINSAADDPSGNAIATNLTSKVGGLQQAVNNVQNGVNALNVANGALKAAQDILVRINNLLVEANSDINSSADLARHPDRDQFAARRDQRNRSEDQLQRTNVAQRRIRYLRGIEPVAYASGFAKRWNAERRQRIRDTNSQATPGPLITSAAIPNIAGFNIPAYVVFTVVGSGQQSRRSRHGHSASPDPAS